MLNGSMDGSAAGNRLVVATGSYDQAAAFESILWFGGLVIVLLPSALVAVRIRKRFRRSDGVPGIGPTPEGLRRQRDGDTADSSASPGNLFQGVGRS